MWFQSVSAGATIGSAASITVEDESLEAVRHNLGLAPDAEWCSLYGLDDVEGP